MVGQGCDLEARALVPDDVSRLPRREGRLDVNPPAGVRLLPPPLFAELLVGLLVGLAQVRGVTGAFYLRPRANSQARKPPSSRLTRAMPKPIPSQNSGEWPGAGNGSWPFFWDRQGRLVKVADRMPQSHFPGHWPRTARDQVSDGRIAQ